MPFPEPSYREFDLVKSYEILEKFDTSGYYNIQTNIRTGDRIMYHFHPSIWHQALPGKISPYDAWYDDSILKQHIKDHLLYHTHFNKNKILQGFNLSPTAPRMRFISPGKAKLFIKRYLKEYDTIFDPNMGYNGIILGTVSLGKEFLGICRDEIVHRETTDMIQFLKKYYSINVNLNPVGVEFPCMFTEVKDDTEITECLSTYKCSKYVFITTGTEKYNMYVVDMITTKVYDDTKVEYVLVIER